MSAVTRLALSLGVEKGEGRVFLWGAATLFLIGWASVSLTNVAETFFLKRIGVDLLPIVFLANSLLLVVTTYVVSHVAARREHRLALAITFVALAGMVTLLWLLVLGQVKVVFVLLVLAAKQVDAIALIVFWIVLGGELHGRQAKRLYAPMIAGGTLGKILGSFASGFIGGAVGIGNLLPASAMALVLAALLGMRVRKTLPAHLARMAGHEPAASPPPGLANFGLLWRESRLFRLLAAGALCAGTLGPMLYFQFSYVVDAATRGANAELRLLGVYASLRGFIHAGVLGMQLLGTPRVFRRIGVPLAATLSPVVYLAGFFGVSARLDLAAAIGAVATTNVQDHAVQEPAQQILATLVPERARAAAISLVEGPIQRLGGAMGNVLVLGALAMSSPASVGFVALPIAAFWLASAAVLWRIYPTLLLEAAAGGALQTEVAQSMSELVDSRTLRALSSRLVDPDPRLCRAACALIVESPHRRSVAALARAIGDAPAANRPLLIVTLHDLLERLTMRRPMAAQARDVEPFLTEAQGVPTVERAHLVGIYARLDPPCLLPANHAAGVLCRLLDDREGAVRLAAKIQLASGTPSAGASENLDVALAGAFATNDSAAHRVALEALRTILLPAAGVRRTTRGDAERWQARVTLVAERLADPRDRARAAEILADIAKQDGPRLAALEPLVLRHADDDDPRVRAAIVRFVGQARLSQHTGWLIERLGAHDPREAAAAVEALGALGPLALNALLHTLARGKRALRNAILPILRDLPADRATLQALIDEEVAQIQDILVRMHGLRSGPGLAAVLQRLSERVADGVHTTLLLFAALLHEERIAALGRLLAHSPDPRRQAVLFEALETLLPPNQGKRLISLLERHGGATAALEAAQARGRELPSFDDAVRATLADPDQLTRELAEATLDGETRRRLTGNSSPPDALASVAAVEHHGADGAAMLSRVEIILQLRSLDIFARVTTRELGELAALVREEAYESGRTIVREGDLGDCMYVVVEGEVQVSREGRFVARLAAGEFFGEMALFNGETRVATVTAASRVRVLRIERRDLLELMDEQPGIAIAMCQTLSARVHELINQIEGGETNRTQPPAKP